MPVVERTTVPVKGSEALVLLKEDDPSVTNLLGWGDVMWKPIEAILYVPLIMRLRHWLR